MSLTITGPIVGNQKWQVEIEKLGLKIENSKKHSFLRIMDVERPNIVAASICTYPSKVHSTTLSEKNSLYYTSIIGYIIRD